MEIPPDASNFTHTRARSCWYAQHSGHVCHALELGRWLLTLLRVAEALSAEGLVRVCRPSPHNFKSTDESAWIA